VSSPVEGLLPRRREWCDIQCREALSPLKAEPLEQTGMANAAASI
jgi:hypothetical protein